MPILFEIRGYSLHDVPQLSHLSLFQSLVSLGHTAPCNRPKEI